MRSNLAELDDLVGQYVANDDKAPRIAVGEATRRIAGFIVPDTDMRDQNIAKRRGAISNYRSARDRISAKLASIGITPLAMLPEKTWNQICTESGLYRIQPDKNGEIAVSTTGVRFFMIAGFIGNLAFWSAFPAVLLYTLLYDTTGWGKTMTWSIGLWLVGLIATVVVGIIFYNLDSCPYINMYGWFVRQSSRVLNRLPHRVSARLFLPERMEPEASLSSRHDYRRITRTAIHLPTPPKDTADVLRRAITVQDADMRQAITGMRIAVVEDGFAFVEPPSRIITKHLRKHLSDKQQAWQNTKIFSRFELDPIVYFVEDGVAVIIAQFGDFPIEQEVVERICNTPEYLF